MADPMKFLSAKKKGAVNDAALNSEWTAQKWIWVNNSDPNVIFSKANILADKGESYDVKLADNNEKLTVSKNDTFKMNPPKFDMVEDMAELAYLNEPAVLENMRQRYYNDMIYTYSGLFCVVVNPYKGIPIYTPEVVEMYRGRRRAEVPPHVFNIADEAYRNMLHNKENQSILVTGESGAGKTENTKKVIQYIAIIASGESEQQGKLEEQLLMCNPILEAFGNAKTNKNDNSSRFGKFIKIEFDRSGYISGGNIVTYLLEKSRVARQGPGERNFHIFYQMLAALDSNTQKELLLDGIDEVSWISDKRASKVASMDDSKEFHDTVKAMNVVGITEQEQSDCWRVLAGIMKMSKLTFTQNRQEQAQMTDDTAANMLCKLYNLPIVELTKAMLKPRLKVGADYVIKAQRQDQVESAIEAIVKATYALLFGWIVKKVNNALDTRAAHSTFIGILDIAGFEIFEMNGFDQLCINFTNEKLQQFFNHHMFVVEQEEYTREGITWDFIDFGLDLEPQIELIEGNKAEKVSGVLDLLDDACHLLPRSNEKTFIDKLDKERGNHIKYVSLSGPKSVKSDVPRFKIIHYAGTVEYTVDNWLVKNQDPLNDNITALFAKSSFTFLKNLFSDYAGESKSGGSRARRGAMRTVAYNYRDSLQALMTTLHATSPHFVRCIIPNHEKKPGKLALQIVLDQLRCNGVLEGIRICRQGFPNRVIFAEFKQRYEILAPGAIPKGFVDGKSSCEMILTELGKVMDLKSDQYRIGQTKIFFRTGVLGQLEELRDERLSKIIRNIQAHCQGYLARRAYDRIANFEVSIKRIQLNVRKYLALRKWPWWFVYNSVRVLIPTKQQDDLHVKINSLSKEKEDLEGENGKLKEEKAALEGERDGFISQIKNLEADIGACNEQIDRLAAKNEEALNDLENMENDIREAESRTAEANQKRFLLESQLEEIQDELSTSKGLAATLTTERNQLKDKLEKISIELDEQKDNNSKISKEKLKVEAELADTQAQLASSIEKAKKLEKSGGKVGEVLAETEDKLQKMTAAKTKAENEKRALATELTTANDRIAELEAKVAELEAELAKAKALIVAKDEEIEEKNREIQKLKNENRDLASQLEDVKEQIEDKTAQVDKYKKEVASYEKRIEELNEDLYKGDEDKLLSLKTKQSELEQLKRELATTQEESEQQMHSTKKSLQDKINLLEADLDGLNSQKKEAERQIAALKGENATLQEDLEKSDAQSKAGDKKARTLQEQLNALQAQLEEKTASEQEQADQITKLRSDNNRLSNDLEEKELSLGNAERSNKQLQEKIEEANEKYEVENREKLQLKSTIRKLEEENDSLKEELREAQDLAEDEKRAQGPLNAQIADLKSKLVEAEETNENGERLRSKLKKELEESNENGESLQRAASNHKATADRLQMEKDDVEAELSELRNAVTKANNKARKLEGELSALKVSSDQAINDAEEAKRQVGETSAKLYEAKNQLEDLEDQVSALKSKNKNLAEEVDSLKTTGGDVANLKSEIQSLKALLNEKDIEVNELNDDLIQVEDQKVRQEIEISNLKNKLTQAQINIETAEEEAKAAFNKKLRDLQDELEEVERQKSSAVNKAQAMATENMSLNSQIDDVERQKNQAQENARRVEQLLKQTQNELEELRADGGEFANRCRELEAKVKSLQSQNAGIQADYDRAERARRTAEAGREEASSECDVLRSQVGVATDKARRAENELAASKEEIETQAEEIEEVTTQKTKLNSELESLKASTAGVHERADEAEKKCSLLQRKMSEAVDAAKAEGDDAKRRINQQLIAANANLTQIQSELDEARRSNEELNRKNKRSDRKTRELTNEAAELQSQLEEARANSDRMTTKTKSLQRQLEETEAEIGQIKSRLRRAQTECEEKDDEIHNLQGQIRAKRAPASARRPDKADSDDDDDDDEAATEE